MVMLLTSLMLPPYLQWSIAYHTDVLCICYVEYLSGITLPQDMQSYNCKLTFQLANTPFSIIYRGCSTSQSPSPIIIPDGSESDTYMVPGYEGDYKLPSSVPQHLPPVNV